MRITVWIFAAMLLAIRELCCCNFHIDLDLVRCAYDGIPSKNGLRLATKLQLLDNCTEYPNWTYQMPKLQEVKIRSNYIYCCTQTRAGIRHIFERCKTCVASLSHQETLSMSRGLTTKDQRFVTTKAISFSPAQRSAGGYSTTVFNFTVHPTLKPNGTHSTETRRPSNNIQLSSESFTKLQTSNKFTTGLSKIKTDYKTDLIRSISLATNLPLSTVKHLGTVTSSSISRLPSTTDARIDTTATTSERSTNTVFIVLYVLLPLSIMFFIFGLALCLLKFNAVSRCIRRIGRHKRPSTRVANDSPYGMPLSIVNENYNPKQSVSTI